VNKLTKGAVVGAALIGGSIAMGGQAFASADAAGAAVDSPGVLSGNNLQVPVDVPINLCGNTIDVIGALNPAFGNVCVNGDGEAWMPPAQPVEECPPPPVEECPPPAPPVEECPPEEIEAPPAALPLDDCPDPANVLSSMTDLASGATTA